MKRSLSVSAPLLASAALAVMATGCRQAEPKRCVDENNHVVDQSFCAGQPMSGNQATGNGGSHYTPGFYPYHFYYGGLGGYALGALASGGSSTPVAGHSYSTSARGGFGSSFGGGGRGGGEGGGHGGGGGE